MARDDANDTGRPAAADIPDIHRPRHVAGALTSQFDLSADGRENAERELSNRGMAFVGSDPTQSAPSFILSGAVAVARNIQIAETQKRQLDDERFALDQMKKALEARLAELDAEIAAIDKRLEDIRLRRIVIADQMEALDEVERLRKSGKLDPNNPAHARLLRAAGISDAEARSGDFAAIIAQRRLTLGNEDEALGNEQNSLLKRRDVVARERLAVAGAQSELENADTDEARILAERRAGTVLGTQQLGEAASRTSSQTAKRVAADAVAANEPAAVRVASQRWDRQVVESVDSVTTTSTAQFDFDAEPPNAGPSGAPMKPAP